MYSTLWEQPPLPPKERTQKLINAVSQSLPRKKNAIINVVIKAHYVNIHRKLMQI